MDIYILTYDELQKKIVEARKKHFSDDLTHPTFIKEKVIVMDTRENLEAISAMNFSFILTCKSNT